MSETNPQPLKVAIIIGSIRGHRVSPKVAEIVKNHIDEQATASNIALTLVDIKAFNLPVLDEDLAPAMIKAGEHKHAHSRAWSAEIAKYDGYIWVVPEYNSSVSGAAKNAIDYLYNEWTGKGAVVVSYGIFGGLKAGEHLSQSLQIMKLKVAETRPALAYHGNVGPDLTTGMTTGEVAEATRNDWEGEKVKGEVVKAFGELVGLIKV
ncbi:NADPH-dependent FMN reductase [Eremomyces bilateralis CBS 781.70]|uniref:NADPH-dependent FMN reductase n=1 Tax=Eremomyces bilateralis CBS 781.70 TaxID=1392243 RepID=A0A6G1G9E7_9PEZI|nr:NADPH-dependent FMN reductase [Eremomyces bilateralis CBS 781.70]KAF1814708.1 NADPH-dependent FMN reductase [Eremomyces bilateralis CBS 781.70]